MKTPAKTEKDQNFSSRFKPGQSGNPNGRPKGSRHRVTLLAERLVDGAAEEVVAKLIEYAKQGEPMALRILLDRILPPRKDRPTPFSLPPIKKPSDLPAALGAIANAVGEGDITLAEGAEASRLLENFAKAIEMTELALRVDALERAR
jgi:hypothetical protein